MNTLEKNIRIDLDTWVNTAPAIEAEHRVAVHIIITAISLNTNLADSMIMKGGSLLAILYNSKRRTTDIDFSTKNTLHEIDIKLFKEKLNNELSAAQVELGYTTKCIIQSYEVKPREDATFPTIHFKVGYADLGSENEKERLLRGRASKVVSIDYSFNEEPYNIEVLGIEDNYIKVYSIHDLIAEKYRAIIQQTIRNRSRFQDIYDLNFLTTEYGNNINDYDKNLILTSMEKKFQSRGLEKYFHMLAMDNQEVYDYSKKNYHTIENTIDGPLPDFDDSYTNVNNFFKNLPWKGER